MEFEAENLSADELCICEYLQLWPGQFVPGLEISRRADDQSRFLEDPSWAGTVLGELLELGLIESDGNGGYRLRGNPTVMLGGRSRFIAPDMVEILANSGRRFDLRA